MLNRICLNPPWSSAADFVSFYGRRTSEASACRGMREGHGMFGLQERMKGFGGQVVCSHQNSTAATYDNLQSVKKGAREGGMGCWGRKDGEEKKKRERERDPWQGSFCGGCCCELTLLPMCFAF